MSLSFIKCLRMTGIFAVLAMLVLAMADPLMAGENEDWVRQRQAGHRHSQHWNEMDSAGVDNNSSSVPEISLGEAGAAATLIVGSVLILTDRLRRRRFALKSE